MLINKANLLFHVEHRKRQHEVVFRGLVVRARIANHVDEFLELERRLPVRELADVLVA
jgi:hypothetical protein